MSYTILPLRFMRWSPSEVFLTNEVGEYVFLSNDDFDAFVQGRLERQSSNDQVPVDAFTELETKHFLCTGQLDNVLAMMATKYRSKKSFLQGFTQLHMIVPTLRCNSSCIYCQVSRKRLTDERFDMTEKTADNVIKTIFAGPSPIIKIEFQGGDPAANFKLVQYLIEKAKLVNILKKRVLDFVICTNTTLLSREQIQYLHKHNVAISTSLDGPHDLHNLNRPLQGGQDHHSLLMQQLALIREIYQDPESAAALMTTSKHSLGHMKDIIDEYVRCGFNSIFLRALNPYGFAKNYKEKVAYPIEDFVSNFIEGLNYIIELNLKGTFFVEGYTALLLKRILTPFATGFVDLQSPAGAGISCAIYDYDGRVYVSDEGRMMARFKDYFFCLGNVNTDSYQQLFNGEKMHQMLHHACVDNLPQCAYCAFAPYCGADPVRNQSEQGSMVGFRPTNDTCRKNMALIRYILALLKRNDPDLNRVFWSWIR
ncbi:MAG TPA: His-Xaa-Ser system radical SAM maturase HxsB [Candidatus Anaerobiospirillum pullistercoris]|uniref:His-Xaa-Ser system radical SAM maturase HxsB n=1 Tax=Candidatus Anaerobiospirillum pullistercoris TaxID=2838452 RepID=A0A9D1WG67_9GAMM|nr:His-Xaa-Ser system radical SAM maturase HxsB [Candidatus Anaerobiospirillum pullistercoris]